jgi:hypothetical protein
MYTGQQCVQIITTFVNNVKRFMVLALIAWSIQSLQYLSLNKCLNKPSSLQHKQYFMNSFSSTKKKLPRIHHFCTNLFVNILNSCC